MPPDLQDCCADGDLDHDGSIDTWLEAAAMFAACDDDCNIIINVGGDFINNGQMNLCCQVVKNSGTMGDVIQECSNTNPCFTASVLGTEPPADCVNPSCETDPSLPECPTVPGGGETPKTLEEGTCTAEAKNAGDIGPGGKVIGVGKDGSPVSFVVCYRPPEEATGIAQYKLTQIGGQKYGEVEGTPNPDYGALFSGAKSIATKAVTGVGNQDCFVVATPRLTTLIGEQDLTMEFDVAALALDGSTIHSAKCLTPALAQVQGGGEGGCGCDMKAESPADFANLLIGLAGLIPLALMAGMRKRVAIRK
jgi:hypothetical protein